MITLSIKYLEKKDLKKMCVHIFPYNTVHSL